MSLLNAPKQFKPIQYPFALEAWEAQQKLFWLPFDVPMTDDVRDWKHNLNDAEKNLLINIFRFFTQADVEVECQYSKYKEIFKPHEIKMMIAAFENYESIHVVSYSYLIDTLGMPEIEHTIFKEIEVMRKKSQFLDVFNLDSNSNAFDIAVALGIYAAFIEGMQLFSSFAVLMNFPRFNKMKGMGQIIKYSLRDESLHIQSMLRLFHIFVQEYRKDIYLPILHERLQKAAEDAYDLEIQFIHHAFSLGDVKGLKKWDLIDYVGWLKDLRLFQLGVSRTNEIMFRRSPLPWMDEVLHLRENVNFFDNQSTEYVKAGPKGEWEW